MNTGHEGSMTTIHATRRAMPFPGSKSMRRNEQYEPAEKSVRQQIASAITIVVQARA